MTSPTKYANNPFLNPPFEPLQTRQRSNAVLCPNCTFLENGDTDIHELRGREVEQIVDLDATQHLIIEVKVRILDKDKNA